jgi:hypothetical protein
MSMEIQLQSTNDSASCGYKSAGVRLICLTEHRLTGQLRTVSSVDIAKASSGLQRSACIYVTLSL